MERDDLYDAIFKRKSVRKFEAGPLDAATLAKVSAFLETVRPMIPEIRTEMRIISAADVKAGLSRPKAPHYVAIFSQRRELDLANAGFMLQQVDLFLSASGIGSLWQSNPQPAHQLSKLDFVIMLAFGKAKEPMHRESVGEFDREPLERTNFATGVDDILEAARLAPSATNGQPWIFAGDEREIHFYATTSAMFELWNRISIGAAICHAWLSALHHGKAVEFVDDPKAEAAKPKKCWYVVSMRMAPKEAGKGVEATKATEHQVSYSFEVQMEGAPRHNY